MLCLDNKSTEEIKMNHLKTLICGGFVGADKLERFLFVKSRFKMDKVSASEYRQWILTFRSKYVFVAGKIIRTARQTILKLLKGYPYKEVFQ